MPFTYRRRAARDLEEISAYLERRESIARADMVLDRITTRVRFLAENPTIGAPRDDLVPGIRTWTESAFVIAYRAIGNGIEIVRVVHGARVICELLVASLADGG